MQFALCSSFSSIAVINYVIGSNFGKEGLFRVTLPGNVGKSRQQFKETSHITSKIRERVNICMLVLS